MAASALHQKMVDYAAATATMSTNIWTHNNDEAKTFTDTIFNSIDNGERKDIIEALLRQLETKQRVEKQQSKKETQKHRYKFTAANAKMHQIRNVQQTETTSHELYTIHEELPQKTESTNAIQANNDKEDNNDNNEDKNKIENKNNGVGVGVGVGVGDSEDEDEDEEEGEREIRRKNDLVKGIDHKNKKQEISRKNDPIERIDHKNKKQEIQRKNDPIERINHKNRKQEIRRKNDLIKCIDCTKKEENNTLVTTNLNCSVAEGDNIKNKRKEEEKRW